MDALSFVLNRTRFLALLAGGLAAGVAPARAEGVPVRIGAVTGDSFSEAFYGAAWGTFEKAGIGADVLTFNNAGAVAAAVAGGSLDVGTGDIVSLANAIIRGVPLVLIAGGGKYVASAPTTFLCVDENAPYRVARDLEGKPVAVVTLVGLGTASLKAWLTQNGADVDKIRFIELPQSEMAASLRRGVIAGAVLVEPMFSAAKSSVRVLGHIYDAVGKEFLISEWFTTRDWLARNADTARRLVAAIYDTARYANAHPDASLPILSKSTRIEIDRLRGVTRAQYATSLDPAQIQPVLDVAAKYHAITRPLGAASLIAKV